MSKKLPIYFSDDVWSFLQTLMGPDGGPSPTVNTVFEKIQKEHELGSKFDLKEISVKTRLEIPSALERFSAGPAFGTKDHIDKSIDLNDFLIFNPISTFMGRVDSESMLYAGFEIDDPFLVDKSITAQHRDIVLALIDEREITLKRLMMTAKMSKQEIKEMFGDEDYELPPIWLRAENPAYEHIIPKDSQSISIQGVVTFNLKQFYRRSTSK